MKEATGELSMTVVVIVAIIAILGILGWLFIDQNSLGQQWIRGMWTEMTQH